jgi:uncharacterized protein with HEPN domain
VLGEASRQLLDVLPDAPVRFPEIPLRKMYELRNRLIHGYSTINTETVWRIVRDQIPPTLAAVESALANWPPDLA